MTVFKPPKTFKHHTNISNDSIYLKGPSAWKSSLISTLEGYQDIKIMSSNSDFVEGWEIESIDKSEAAFFYFDNSIEVFNIVTALIAKMTQFPAETYVYIDDEYEYKELVEQLCGFAKIKVLKTKKEIRPLVLQCMSYLLDKS